MVPLKDLLFKYRVDHDLNQTELGKLLKVAQPLISCWESGKKVPNVEQETFIRATLV